METTLYNSKGVPQVYIADDNSTIYTWGGHAVAYIIDDAVYGWNGKHLGFFEHGIIYDLNGYKVGYTKEACPYAVYASYAKCAKYAQYAKYGRYARYTKPSYSLSNSSVDLLDFVEQGKI